MRDKRVYKYIKSTILRAEFSKYTFGLGVGLSRHCSKWIISFYMFKYNLFLSIENPKFKYDYRKTAIGYASSNKNLVVERHFYLQVWSNHLYSSKPNGLRKDWYIGKAQYV